MYDDLTNKVEITTGVISKMRGYAWKAEIVIFADNPSDILKEFDNTRRSLMNKLHLKE